MLNAQSPFSEQTRSSSCVPFAGLWEQPTRDAKFPLFNQPKEADVMRDQMKPVEDILASEMSKLSVQERSKALDDVHCVGDELHETPEIVEKSLREFQQLIEKEKNPIYEMAVNQNRAFVEDPEFRLKFLRASLHDVWKAVRNMLEFLRFKATYFDEEKLTREITLDDLDEDDRKVLFSGLHHIQAGTDRMGRIIFCVFNSEMGKGETGSHIRSAYHVMYNILASNPAAQKKGVVYCYYDLSKPGEEIAKPGFSLLLNILQFMNCIPVRPSVNHSCLRTGDGVNVALNKFLVEFGMKVFPHHLRIRTRIHFGTDMEIQYELQDHGIPLDTFPIDSFGNIRKDIQMVWLDEYHAREALRTKAVGVDDPTPSKSLITDNSDSLTSDSTLPADPPRHDILLGRGKPIRSHMGNVCFREYLRQFSGEYDQTPRNLKREFLAKIREDLNSRGIRFRQERNGEWVECSSAEAEKTISQAFRNMRKKNKKEENAI